MGKVFTPQDVDGRTWMKEFAQAPTELVLDDFVRVYFPCRPQPDQSCQYVSLRLGGESFTQLGDGPVLSYSPHEPFVLSGPKIRPSTMPGISGTSQGVSGRS
jgi:hypothetical protein